jgi:hypothetical protein
MNLFSQNPIFPLPLLIIIDPMIYALISESCLFNIMNTLCGYEVPSMTMCDFKGARQLDHSNDMSVHASTLHQLQFKCINASFMEVVVLIRCIFLCFNAKMSDQSLEQ